MHYQIADPIQQFNEMYLSMHELRKIIFPVYWLAGVNSRGDKM